MNKKFELTSDAIVSMGRTLYRIKALISFGKVSAGDIGGYVEREENLSPHGNAWVYGNARVFGNARVYCDAWVFGNAWVYDNAQVCGDARVCGDAWVYGNARVCGNAQVYDNAQVYGNSRVYGDALVCGDAQVCGDARVCGDAWVYGNARVCGDAKKTPIVISGLFYHVTITDNHIKIGCEFHTIDEWESFDDKRIAEMDGKDALHFWRLHKESIIGFARSHQDMDG